MRGWASIRPLWDLQSALAPGLTYNDDGSFPFPVRNINMRMGILLSLARLVGRRLLRSTPLLPNLYAVFFVKWTNLLAPVLTSSSSMAAVGTPSFVSRLSP